MVRVCKTLLLLPLAMLAGCLHWTERVVEQSPLPRYQVKCGGDCLELNARPPANPSAFLAKVEELRHAKRLASAEILVERHLEAAIDALRQRDTKQKPTEVDLTLARTIDARLKHPADDGWLARLQGRGRGLERAEQTLSQAQEFTRNQQWKSVRDLIQKNQAALAPYPLHAIQAGLTLAEAQRRLGEIQPSVLAWQQAAATAARLASSSPAPALWEQIAAQRPVPTVWPAEVTTALLKLVPASLHGLPKNPAFVPEALVWFAIGHARLERSEASAALTAFKRADSQGALPEWDDFLGLYQAKALLALEQTPAATSLLTMLANRPNGAAWRLSALSLLGTGKLHEGHTQQAFAFLREAVETSNADFPFRADAEANLGLTYLMKGDEANGLRWLHAGQKRFEAGLARGGLLQCYENEANYLAHAGKTEDANRIRQKMHELESR